jgi:hypothetical protein
MRNLVGLDISAGGAELVPESCWGVLPRGILLGDSYLYAALFAPNVQSLARRSAR